MEILLTVYAVLEVLRSRVVWRSSDCCLASLYRLQHV